MGVVEGRGGRREGGGCVEGMRMGGVEGRGAGGRFGLHLGWGGAGLGESICVEPETTVRKVRQRCQFVLMRVLVKSPYAYVGAIAHASKRHLAGADSNVRR